MKPLEVQIMGQSYTLSVPEPSHATMLVAAARVDQAMCRIRDAGKTKARDRIAVLTALNLAFETQSAIERERTKEAGVPLSLQPKDTPGATGQTQWTQAEQLLGRLDAALGKDGQLL